MSIEDAGKSVYDALVKIVEAGSGDPRVAIAAIGMLIILPLVNNYKGTNSWLKFLTQLPAYGFLIFLAFVLYPIINPPPPAPPPLFSPPDLAKQVADLKTSYDNITNTQQVDYDGARKVLVIALTQNTDFHDQHAREQNAMTDIDHADADMGKALPVFSGAIGSLEVINERLKTLQCR